MYSSPRQAILSPHVQQDRTPSGMINISPSELSTNPPRVRFPVPGDAIWSTISGESSVSVKQPLISPEAANYQYISYVFVAMDFHAAAQELPAGEHIYAFISQFSFHQLSLLHADGLSEIDYENWTLAAGSAQPEELLYFRILHWDPQTSTLEIGWLTLPTLMNENTPHTSTIHYSMLQKAGFILSNVQLPDKIKNWINARRGKQYNIYNIMVMNFKLNDFTAL